MARSTVSHPIDFSCGSCGALIQVEAHLRSTTCPYCASPAVVERPPDPSRPRPTFALPFTLPRECALESARRWVRRRVFAREAFRRADVAEIRGIYVPAYLFSAAAHARYSAQIGENYTETYTTTQNGRTVTRTRTKTEWHPLHGSFAAYVSDVVVTASRGLPNHELQAIEPFDLRGLRRYAPALISGWLAEEATVTIDAGRQLAVAEAMAEVKRRIAAILPGDKHSNLEVDARLVDIDEELALVPVWVLPVRFGDAPDQVVRVLVNGQTGRAHGAAPRSWPKILGLVFTVVLLITAIVYAARP